MNFPKISVYLILLVGIILRLSLFAISPPNNSFDNHLEVIKIYANSNERPMPNDCWECYQPPIYYFIASKVLNISEKITNNNYLSWKIVQLINTILSILVLIIMYKIMTFLDLSIKSKMTYLSFLCLLPIDIFTSSMIGNDYLLTFSTVLTLYYYLKIKEYLKVQNTIPYLNLCLLSFFVIMGSNIKQHGLLLLLLPCFIVLYYIVKKSKREITVIITFIVVILILSFGEEYWKFYHTGKFLVSNQDFFDYAKNQIPGSINLVEFNTFRIVELFKNPFLSKETASSFFSELFARTFFDYEWRFLSPRITVGIFLGRFAFLIGLIWILFFGITTFIGIKRINVKQHLLNVRSLLFICLPILGILFFLVPLIQTLRYPYYSSMKSTFILPGIFVFIIAHSLFTKQIRFPTKLNGFIIFFNFLYSTFLIFTIGYYFDIVINHLSGPIWPIP